MAIDNPKEIGSSSSRSALGRKEIVSDFSAPEYWSNRFEREKAFEWLADTRAIGPMVLELVQELSQARLKQSQYPLSTISTQTTDTDKPKPPLNILHFGCGTSSLGPDLATLLNSNGINVKLVDADYVAKSISSEKAGKEGNAKRNKVPLINLNVLDPDELEATKPDGGWDLLLDKSTADAISCGRGIKRRIGNGNTSGSNGDEKRSQGAEVEDSVQESEYELVEPIQILCDNLAAITRKDGKWLCVSYSSTRFDHLKSTSHPSSTDTTHAPPHTTPTTIRSAVPSWRLVSARPIDGAYTAPPSAADAGTRVVYAPETNVWGYILERV